ncbi:4Fe-4S dicluster domain-containing protein [Nitratidesulfovibrio sp. 1201_IL3209]|uniref:4Fe-4S dicluster domain-containing protein n=1 Tax=Nitratidesulfovibrio sp. 1201_IL3209 TaxID=3084053 RepID=UPI002FD9E47B
MSDRAPSPFIVNGCRGTTVSSSRGGTCRFSLPVPEGFLVRLERVVAESGWPEFLRDVVRGPILHHHAFRVAVSACPNGCSRPHIADVGIIRAWTPGRASDACTRCGLCERLCPDHAMTLGEGDEDGPRLHPENCLSCGLCIKRCPEKALPVAREGWRVVVGGRLGRRPRLATELEGLDEVPGASGFPGQSHLLDDDGVVRALRNALAWYMREYRLHLRFGDLVASDPATAARLAGSLPGPVRAPEKMAPVRFDTPDPETGEGEGAPGATP